VSDEQGFLKAFLKRRKTLRDIYYGKITAEVYAEALELRGDDDTCWGERVPLASPALVLGAEWPEDLDGNAVIDIWEKALCEAEAEMGHKNFTLEVTIYFQEAPNSLDGRFVWEKSVKPNR
jgi:hypothetical protein